MAGDGHDGYFRAGQLLLCRGHRSILLNLLRTQQANRSAVERESRKELEKLRKLKQVSLTEPLAEKTRPATMDDIIGQEEGLKALRRRCAGRILSTSSFTVRPASARRPLPASSSKRPNATRCRRLRVTPSSSKWTTPQRPALTIAACRPVARLGARPDLSGRRPARSRPASRSQSPQAVAKAHGGILFYRRDRRASPDPDEQAAQSTGRPESVSRERLLQLGRHEHSGPHP